MLDVLLSSARFLPRQLCIRRPRHDHVGGGRVTWGAVPGPVNDAVPSVNGPHNVAVIAHRKKSLGEGLPELRRALAVHGVPDPTWYEISKSKEATTLAEKAVAGGVSLLIIWGGDSRKSALSRHGHRPGHRCRRRTGRHSEPFRCQSGYPG